MLISETEYPGPEQAIPFIAGLGIIAYLFLDSNIDGNQNKEL